MSALKTGLEKYDVLTTRVEIGRRVLSLIADSIFDLVSLLFQVFHMFQADAESMGP